MALPWENIGAGITGIPFPLMQLAGGADGMRGLMGGFADSDVGRSLGPAGEWIKEYNPWATDEDKYGQRPGAFNPDQYAGLGGGQYDRMYQNQMAGLGQNVGPNDPYMQQLMNAAGAGASRDAKLRGLSGPYSINANERARMAGGLEYAQKENARRQALLAQLMGQYGDLSERRRQFNTGLAYDRYKSDLDAYNQRVAGHNTPLNFIPGIGRAAYASYTAKKGAY